MTHYLVMIKLNIHQIKSHFSKYIELVEQGETVVVCKRNIPVAEIRAIPQKKEKPVPVLGSAEGMGKIASDFNRLPVKELQQWEGDENDPLKKYAPRRKKSQR